MSNAAHLYGQFSDSILSIVKGTAFSQGDSEKAFKEITEAATSTLKVARASIWMAADDWTTFKCIDLYEHPSGRHTEGAELNEADFPAYFKAISEDRIIDAHDAHQDPRTCEFSQTYLTPLGITSMLDTPIRLSGAITGILCLEHVGPLRHWSAEELSYAASLANLVTHAVEARKRKVAEQALKESEQRFRDFAESSSDWLWEMDADLRFTYFSDNLHTVGVAPEEMYGKTRRETIGSENDPEIVAAHLQTLENHQPFRGLEFLRILEGKKAIWTRTSGVPIFDEDNNFIGYRGSANDITDRKALEMARDAAFVAAERANQVKSEFLATMSHEFRTPLNAILGFSEMLKNEYFGPLGSDHYREYANDIHHSGNLMLKLVNDILDISAIEAGKRTLVNEPINIREMLNSCIKNVEPTAARRQISLTTNLPDALPSLYADARSIMQIMLNLLSNAVKFTDPHGSVTVTADLANDKVALIVNDSGIGIPADKLPTITEPFIQSNPNPHRAQKGTGLGLSIVNALVEMHDGTMDIESVVGKGTTVTVVLPLQGID